MSITGTKGTRAVRTNYPVTEGLTAETTKQTKTKGLIPEVKSNISARQRQGID